MKVRPPVHHVAIMNPFRKKPIAPGITSKRHMRSYSPSEKAGSGHGCTQFSILLSLVGWRKRPGQSRALPFVKDRLLQVTSTSPLSFGNVYTLLFSGYNLDERGEVDMTCSNRMQDTSRLFSKGIQPVRGHPCRKIVTKHHHIT